MLPSRTIESFLQQHPRDLQDIVLELRSLIVRIAPAVTETRTSRGFNYYHKERGGPVSAGVCQITVHDDHVRLAFLHGAYLPDPANHLEGDTMPKRFVRLTSYATVPWDDLRDLLIHSSRFDPRTLEFH